MTDQDKLTKIRAKCVALEDEYLTATSAFGKRLLAMTRGTIAAIDKLGWFRMEGELANELYRSILEAWPDELLD